MNSPILEDIFKHIKIDTTIERAIYLQLADAILILIKEGRLRTGQKLLSSRTTANLLGINRITVSKAFEELQMQGWLESFIGRGTFVSSHIPELTPKRLKNKTLNEARKVAGFTLNEKEYLFNPYFPIQIFIWMMVIPILN